MQHGHAKLLCRPRTRTPSAIERAPCTLPHASTESRSDARRLRRGDPLWASLRRASNLTRTVQF
ncbi:Hypothetical protein I596_1113 [Dokdonella koreensis DS-123]|uniref:Uncharacterized protein n=1 Tax=Dokdonella koreensis DS-123 TaxID=1300342 RepID=A0A160DU16_9GAMM|nr:Hypothetical protein I596_1113 [Dokdonella koreensis DS-123]